jgi:hypothetical protein
MHFHILVSITSLNLIWAYLGRIAFPTDDRGVGVDTIVGPRAGRGG